MKGENRKLKLLPVYLLVIIDVLALGVALCVFALFHHVIPVAYSPAPVYTKPAAGQAEYEGEEPALHDEKGTDFNFPGIFAEGDEPEITENLYRSKNVYVKLTKVQRNGVTYFVQDIYLRNLSYLRTAFAQDTYGKAITEHPLDIAVRNDAVAAINGDYYGTHSRRGVVIRNGIIYRADEAYGDVCFLGYDGVMWGVTEDEFNRNPEAYIDNVYQGWCFGPILVEDGVAKSGFDKNKEYDDIAGRNPRTAIGYFEPGHYCFIAVDGRREGYSVGLTLDELAQLCQELGCKFAFNLDGGKSTVMVWRGRLANRPDGGGREQSDIVYIADGGLN